MKKILLMFILLTINCFCFAQINFTYFEINSDSKISFKKGEKKLYLDYYNMDQFFIFESVVVNYEGKQLPAQISYVINTNNSRLLKKLYKNKMISINSISNISTLPQAWEDSQLFFTKENFIIKEYIRDWINGWSTDKFGFIIKNLDNNDLINMIEIKILNVFSTLIEEETVISPWNLKTVKSFKNQENIGIRFYYLMENLMKTFVFQKHDLLILGTVNDEKVRFRESNSLDSFVIRYFEKGEELEVVDCSEKENKDTFPWIKVKSKKNEIGYIYGEYIDILVKTE